MLSALIAYVTVMNTMRVELESVVGHLPRRRRRPARLGLRGARLRRRRRRDRRRRRAGRGLGLGRGRVVASGMEGPVLLVSL